MEALKAMKMNARVVEAGEKIQPYYSGRTAPTAHIIIDKSKFRGYANAGFERTKGGFIFHVDDSDKSKIKLDKLSMHYTEKVIDRTIKSTSKYSLLKRVEEKGKVKLLLAAR